MTSPWNNLHQPLNWISQRQDDSLCPLNSSLLNHFSLDKFIWEETYIFLFAELWYYTAWIFSYATSRIFASRALSIFIHAFTFEAATPFSNAYLISFSRGESTETWPNVLSTGLLILQLTWDFFFGLYRKSSASAWKNEIDRCVLCPTISFCYSVFDCTWSERNAFKKPIHLVYRTIFQDTELDWGTPPTCVGRPRAHLGAPLSSTDHFGVMDFLGIYMALCLVFYIPLLREHKHFSSLAGNLTPHLFVDVCPGACLGLGAVTLSRPFKDKHQILLFLLAHFLCSFALSYFWL